MTDLYPSEEGYIGDGLVIGMCKCAGSVTLHSAVEIDATGVSGAVSVIQAAFKEGVAIALKAGATNDYIPVCFYGIVKQLSDGSVGAQDALVSSTTATYVGQIPATWTAADWAFFTAAATFYRLGMALQPGTTAADELLVLVGAIR